MHYVYAAAATGVYAVIECVDDGGSILASLSDDDRSALYISLAATHAGLLGFAIASVAILLTLGSGPRIDWLRKQQEYGYVRKVLMGAIAALAAGTVLFTTLIVTDTAKSPCRELELIACFVLTLALLRLASVCRLLNDLLDIALADQGDAGRCSDAGNPRFTEEVDEDDQP